MRETKTSEGGADGTCFLSIVKEAPCFDFSGTGDNYFHEMRNDMDRSIRVASCESRWMSKIFRAIVEEEIASDAGPTVGFGQE